VRAETRDIVTIGFERLADLDEGSFEMTWHQRAGQCWVRFRRATADETGRSAGP
jgi:hypothetical protein